MKKTSKKSKSLSALSDKKHHNLSTRFTLNTGVLLGILYNLLIIIYLVNLEDVSCQCIMDWRHNYIKYFCGVIIILGLVTLFICVDKTSMLAKVFSTLLFIGGVINTYCLFTYVGDLDTTKCSCAIDKQRTMHYFLYIWRWILLVSFGIMIFGFLLNFLKH